MAVLAAFYDAFGTVFRKQARQDEVEGSGDLGGETRGVIDDDARDGRRDFQQRGDTLPTTSNNSSMLKGFPRYTGMP